VLDGTGSVHALTLDGTPLWSFAATDVPFRDLALGPKGRVVLLADYSSHLLYVLDAHGALQWTCDVGEPLRSVVIDTSGAIYATTSGHKLFAINPDGTVRWSRTFTWDARGGPIIDGQGVVHLAVEKTLFAPNSDGTERWSFQASDSIISGPVIG
jgi:outer membrane protein assembly factor BamB